MKAMFLLDSTKAATAWEDTVKHVHDILTKHHSEIVASRQWDERRLAYPIGSHKKGTYLLTYFRTEGENLKEIVADCGSERRDRAGAGAQGASQARRPPGQSGDDLDPQRRCREWHRRRRARRPAPPPPPRRLSRRSDRASWTRQCPAQRDYRWACHASSRLARPLATTGSALLSIDRKFANVPRWGTTVYYRLRVSRAVQCQQTLSGRGSRAMADLNKVFLMGRLTFDPELRRTTGGTAVTELRMATTRSWAGRDGERREETLFIDVTVWDRQAENCCQFLRKGSAIHVEGSLKMDTWDDKNTGEKRSKIRVHADACSSWTAGAAIRHGTGGNPDDDYAAGRARDSSPRRGGVAAATRGQAGPGDSRGQPTAQDGRVTRRPAHLKTRREAPITRPRKTISRSEAASRRQMAWCDRAKTSTELARTEHCGRGRAHR